MSESVGTPGPRLETFDATYSQEFEYVWRTLGRLGVAPADIPDAVHDVFIVAYRRWSDIDLERPIRPWLFGVARKVASSRRRKQSEIRNEPVEASVSSADEYAQRDLLWKALAALDDDRRDVLVLHELEGHTGADIARMLGIPTNTVHSRLRLARTDLVAAVARLSEKP